MAPASLCAGDVDPSSGRRRPVRTTAIAFSSRSLAIVRYFARLLRSMLPIAARTSGLRITSRRSSTAALSCCFATTRESSRTGSGPPGWAAQSSVSNGSGGGRRRNRGGLGLGLVGGETSGPALDALPQLDERQLVARDLLGQLLALLGILDLHELIRMGQGVLAQRHELTDLVRRVGQPQAVLEVALVLAELVGKLADAVAVVPDHPVVHRRLVERRDVLPLEVLDDRDLHRGLVVDVLDQCRDGHVARELRCPPAALARDQLEAVLANGSDEDRLEDAVLADAGRQLLERRLVEGEAWLLRVGFDAVNGNDLDAGRAMRRLRGEEADDRGRKLTFLGESTSGGCAEVRPGQVRSPPWRARDRSERPRTHWRTT